MVKGNRTMNMHNRRRADWEGIQRSLIKNKNSFNQKDLINWILDIVAEKDCEIYLLTLTYLPHKNNPPPDFIANINIHILLPILLSHLFDTHHVERRNVKKHSPTMLAFLDDPKYRKKFKKIDPNLVETGFHHHCIVLVPRRMVKDQPLSRKFEALFGMNPDVAPEITFITTIKEKAKVKTFDLQKINDISGLWKLIDYVTLYARLNDNDLNFVVFPKSESEFID